MLLLLNPSGKRRNISPNNVKIIASMVDRPFTHAFINNIMHY